MTGPTDVADEFRLALKLALADEVAWTVLVMCRVELIVWVRVE